MNTLKHICALSFTWVFCVALSACGGPLGPLAGGKLSGTPHAGSVDDWAFATTVEAAQLETRPTDPHSINIWVGVIDGNLYVPSSLILGTENPAEREWVQHVLADPRVRLRISDTVYDATATRITDEETVARVKQVLLAKYAEELDAHSEAAWIFRLDAR